MEVFQAFRCVVNDAQMALDDFPLSATFLPFCSGLHGYFVTGSESIPGLTWLLALQICCEPGDS